MTNLSNSLYPWYVYAKLNATPTKNGPTLILQDRAIIDNDGMVKFETLGISIASPSINLEYYLDIPIGINA